MMNIKFRSVIFTFSIVLLGFVSCQKDSNSDKLSIEFEKYELENEIRFDVISIIVSNNKNTIEHFVSAF